MFRFLSLIKFICAVSITTALVSCGGNGNHTKPPTDTIAPVSNKDLSIPGNFSTQTTLKFDSAAIKQFLDSFPQFEIFANDIDSFYQNRKFAYAWFDEKGLIEPANNLYNRVENITADGLKDTLPYQQSFTLLMDAPEPGNKPSTNLELMLTSQYLMYAKKVWQGVSEKQSVAMEWLLPRKKLSYKQLLDSLSGNKILENEPVYRQYGLLKSYLKKFNEIKAKNNLSIIKTDKKKLQKGDSATVIADIRQWLFIMGDMETDNQSNVFDEPLEQAVKNLQARLGLKQDGIIGTSVIAEMNYPIEKRIEAIMVNMERSRWVPASNEKDYLLVNIPDYKLYVFENDSIAFTMNVVVGKDQHKTVIFNGDMKYVVFSPYWNIPYSILKNETLPAIKRNSNYLAKHNMEWNGGNVRQKPGPDNSLGLVKFLFPNTHSIYLHDSPAKSLFSETDRAFSHGCIRLAEPKKLAVYLLRKDARWNEASIGAAMNSGKEQTVTLSKTVPVFIAYFTAWVDRKGKMNFRKDVYNRDRRLAQLILDKPSI